MVTRLVPVDYFFTLYIALYFISPYINKIVIGYDNKEWKKLLFISMIFLSFLPIASDILTEVTNKQWLGSNTIGHWGGFGHTLINFVLVYIIGGYLSFTKYVIVSKKKLLFIIQVCSLTLIGWQYASIYVFHSQNGTWSSYYNPIVLILAASIIKLFGSIDIKSVIINKLAGAAFSCYLLKNVILSRVPIENIVKQDIIHLILYVIIVSIVTYLFSYVFYIVYKTLKNYFIYHLWKLPK